MPAVDRSSAEAHVPPADSVLPAALALVGRHVVATAESLETATYPIGALVLRLAPDDVLIVGDGPLQVDDPHAIIEDERGLVALTFSWPDFDVVVAPFVDWSLPLQRPVLAQGYVAAIPTKLWLEVDRVLLITHAAYAVELIGRLS